MQWKVAAGPGDEAAQEHLPHVVLGTSSGSAESAEPACKQSGQSISVELDPGMQHGVRSVAPGKTAHALGKHAGPGVLAHLSTSSSMAHKYSPHSVSEPASHHLPACQSTSLQLKSVWSVLISQSQVARYEAAGLLPTHIT